MDLSPEEEALVRRWRERGAGAPEPPATPMLDQLKSLAGVVAPTTVAAALLYYFGYVTTYARFAYFGVDLSTLGLSTQELALRSIGAIFPALAVMLLLGLAVLLGQRAVRAARLRPRAERVLRIGGTVIGLFGVVMVVRAVTGMLWADLAERELPGLTPLCLGLGPLLVLFGKNLRSAPVARGPAAGTRLAVQVLVAGLAVLGLFWLTNTFAAAYGRGQGEADRVHMAERPAVTLDTQERLYLRSSVQETTLPPDSDQKFRYRYRDLRLLIEAQDRLFLVPSAWQPGLGSVIVVAHDADVRVQFAP